MTNKAPIDFFQLFITDTIVESIVEQTNLFAQQYTDSRAVTPLTGTAIGSIRARHGGTKEVPRPCCPNGAYKFSIYRGLLGYILALCNFHL